MRIYDQDAVPDFVPDWDGFGPAGVREPRRPLPKAPATNVGELLAELDASLVDATARFDARRILG